MSLKNSPKTIYLICLMLISLDAASQSITPWLTTGTKSALLQIQPQISWTTSSNPTNVAVAVDSTVSYQKMDGFGFCLTEGSAEVISTLSAAQQDALISELFDPVSGLGISVLRISIGASDLSSADYTYNDTAGDVSMSAFSLAGLDKIYLLPLLKKILAVNPNIKILATPWTAPRWMKSTLSWIGGTLNTAYYAAYATYFIKYFDAMKAEGIPIWAITPQNEPLYQGNDPSMGMSSSEQINFINNYLGPAMSAAGYSGIKIIAYDHNCDNTAYPTEVCNNSQYVDGSAFHLYGGNISALTTVKNATNKNVYFTEQYTASNGSFSGDLGWHLQNIIIGSATNWAKAIIEWNLANNAAIGPHTPGGCSTCLGAVTINNGTVSRNVSYYIVGQISKFVKASATRIYASSNSSSVTACAFQNPDHTTALVLYNSSSNSQTLRVGMSGQSFYYTVAGSSAVTFTWGSAATAIAAASINEPAINLSKGGNEISIKNADRFNCVSLFSANGKLVLRQPIEYKDVCSIAVSTLKKGAYIISLEGDKTSLRRKFIKL